MDIGGLHAGSPMHFLQLFVVGVAIGVGVVVFDALVVAPAEAAVGLQPAAAA